ncbi:unnamed protein product [Rhizoctonia solani]|uniref:Uncharacterized protein n=1 Tax=Rhizoctonia solani TaxID=456999 RepID=A0A8H3AIQ1_9AGAM|nr:unnamed protein product [Rhizoctonia solani]
MLGAARAAARAIRRALVQDDIYAAQKTLSAYQGPSRLPLTALVHGTIRTRRPMAAAIAIESHLANAKSLPAPTLQAYISALTSSEPQIIPTETAHTPVTAALTVLAAARRSRQQQRTTHMYDAAIRACLIQGEIITGSLLFVLLVRDWQRRHRDPPVDPPDPAPDPAPTTPSPLEKWDRSFPTAFTSPIPPDAPIPPFPSPHIMEAIISALDLRPKPNPQTTHDLPPGRPPDSILALAHLTRIFSDRALPFSRYASLLNALARTPPMADKVETYFHGILRQTCHNPPLMDTRSYNVLINYSLSVVRKPGWAERLVEHMSTIRSPPLRITDATRAIITRGEAKLREPGLAARILSHIDARGHSTRLPSNSAPPAPPSTPLYALVDLPKDPHLLAAHIHNLTSLGTPTQVLQLVNTLLPNLHIPPTSINPRTKHTLECVLRIGPTALTSILNALCKSGKTGLAERVHRLGVLAEQIPASFILPLAFHTTIVQLYAQEARKGLVVIEPRPSPLAPPHKAKAIVDAGTLLAPTPALAKSSVEGWGYDVQTPGGRTHRGIKRWALARSAAAHVYLTYIRPRLLFPSQIQSQSQSQPQYIPDARLYNSLFDVFGRRPNMLLRTHLSKITRARNRRGSTKTGIPSQTDAFVQVLVKDMVAVGMKEDVPGGWSHFIPIDYAAFDYSSRNVLETAYRMRHPAAPSGRWKVHETRMRMRFRPRLRASIWARLAPYRKGNQFMQSLNYVRAKPQRQRAQQLVNLEKALRRELAQREKELEKEVKTHEVDEFWNHLSASREREMKTRASMRRARAEMQRAMARFERARKSEKLPTKRVRDIWLFVQDKVKELAKIKRMATREGEVRVGGGRYKRRRQVLKPSIGNPSSKVTGILPQSQGKDTLPSPRETTPPSAKIAGLGNVPSARPRSKHRKPRRHS